MYAGGSGGVVVVVGGGGSVHVCTMLKKSSIMRYKVNVCVCYTAYREAVVCAMRLVCKLVDQN